MEHITGDWMKGANHSRAHLELLGLTSTQSRRENRTDPQYTEVSDCVVGTQSLTQALLLKYKQVIAWGRKISRGHPKHLIKTEV